MQETQYVVDSYQQEIPVAEGEGTVRLRIISILAALTLLLSSFSGIVPEQATAAATLKSVSASGTVIGGGKIQIKVVLTGKAPAGGAVVSLKTNRPSIVPAPPSVIVPAGQTTVYVNDIVTKGTQTSVVVLITAKFGGVTKNGQTLIRAPYVTSVTGSSSAGAGTNTLNIRLVAKAGVGGMIINVKSSRPSLVVVPETIKVPEGQTSAVLSYEVGAASSQYTYTITAGANDKGAAVVPPDKVVAPVQISITFTRSATPTPTRTATPIATSTPTGGGLSTTCLTTLNDPQWDRTDYYYSIGVVLSAGDTVRIRTVDGWSFHLRLAVAHGDLVSQGYFTDYIYEVRTTSPTHFEFVADTEFDHVSKFDISCGDGSDYPETSTPSASSDSSSATDANVTTTATETIAPPTTVATVAPPPATATGLAASCEAIGAGAFNQVSSGGSLGEAPFTAGEMIAISAGGSAFNLSIPALGLSEPAILSYVWTVPATGSYDVQFASTAGEPVAWDVSCSAPGT